MTYSLLFQNKNLITIDVKIQRLIIENQQDNCILWTAVDIATAFGDRCLVTKSSLHTSQITILAKHHSQDTYSLF